MKTRFQMLSSPKRTSRNQASPTTYQSNGALTSNAAYSATQAICTLQPLFMQQICCKVAKTLALYDSNPLIAGVPHSVLRDILNAFVRQVLASKL